ncbi:hypothetical protein HX779_26400 [Pseudomonas sp. A4002]|uniref:DUF6957 family protein n=1 Tax=unclassified Pseudomonas TaxID=196821 RepID=UPI0015A1E78B|nr:MULTISPECIES: hypothetical protein [unclassified Pseudomonas]NVZ35528.1 hypothetical protein [Pseudomonas sp. A4002]NWB82178.1 hypothetical protein [Pseudomonas sp. F9001]
MAVSPMIDALRDVAELLNGEGESLAGFAGDVAEAEAMVILHPSWKPYCIVRDWMLIEIAVTDEFRQSLAGDGLQPYVLYASNVLSHSCNKRLTGDWVRSTFQRSFEGSVFETHNTVYILLGEGLRKKARIETVMAIVGLY